ncbi:uncharacterized protein SAMN05216534_1669 [Candidatus Aquiluna sp. UB-MaderosW2red]|nr:uncharacterized protein SAMN05216534_1669 [Candidatus Aquiluna sp. UB-MaderosW2red]
MRSQCSHCMRLSVGRELKIPGVELLVREHYQAPDNLAIRYGIKYEAQLEKELLLNLDGLVQAPNDNSMDSTIELMQQGVPVIYQGSLRGGSGEVVFSGRPDFLLRADYRFVFSQAGLTAIPFGNDSRGYSAWDAKLSSSAKPDYQNQVALYLDVLESIGLAAKTEHGLILGSREIIGFDPAVLLAQLAPKRAEFLGAVKKFVDSRPKLLADVGVLICDASSYCDICEYPSLCEETRHESNHLQLVAGITRVQIASLNRSGVQSVRQLADFSGETDKLSEQKVQQLSLQARLQQQTYDTGQHFVKVVNQDALDALPKPNNADMFFDLEGFTFFPEPGGLEYLFGWTSVDKGEEFHHNWADDRQGEKESFAIFVKELIHRQQRFPGSKVYHYANYEQSALRKLAIRHNIYQVEVQRFLERGVFVDLYKLVKSALVISQESYSIKKLENYYEFKRGSDVKEAMGSMDYYDQYLTALSEDKSQAEMLKRQVIAYNQDDCASTLALYKWLLTL